MIFPVEMKQAGGVHALHLTYATLATISVHSPKRAAGSLDFSCGSHGCVHNSIPGALRSVRKVLITSIHIFWKKTYMGGGGGHIDSFIFNASTASMLKTTSFHHYSALTPMNI